MHIAKYTRSSAGHMIKHYIRAKDENGEYVTRNHEEIDPTRTHKNYSFFPDRKNPHDHLNEVLSQIKVLNRKDVVVMADVIVTAPKKFPESDLPQFFETAYNTLTKMFGVDYEGSGDMKNIVSADVHFDETSPHLHFAFVPIMKEKKVNKKTNKEEEIWKCNAKKVVSRTMLKQMHPKMTKAMYDVFGRDVGIENGATKGGNQTIQQLKMKTAVENELKAAQEVLESQNKTISAKKEEIACLNEELAEKTISSELHTALLEKENLLADAERDLEVLCSPDLSYEQLNKAIREWEFNYPPVSRQEPEVARAVLKYIIEYLQDLIANIKELFSNLLGADYENELTIVQDEMSNDEIDID